MMWKYTVQVDGMMCGMCESHVNDAVRKAFPVKKVSSSRSKKETTVIAETDLCLLYTSPSCLSKKVRES